MSETTSSSELIERLVKHSGIKKKLAAEILHVIPGIIEEGLNRDGEVRVKGLGTFRMKWTKGRIGRNPKTGEKVEIPAHNRMVFLPEQSLKDYINRDFRLLGYKVIPAAVQQPEKESIVDSRESIVDSRESIVDSRESIVVSRESIVDSRESIVDSQQPAVPPEAVISVEPEPVVAKRRIHWIIPTAVAVIIVLSLVFYFRNFYHPGESSQLSVVSQESLVDSRESLVDSRESLVVSHESLVVSHESLVDNQQPVISTQNSEPKTQNSKLKTQNSELLSVLEGKRLFQLAREVYGNPFLWVLIYKENQEKIPDPDMLLSGTTLAIPALEGKPAELTRNDSIAVSEGYRLVYEFYKSKGDTKADDYYLVYKRYSR